MNQAYFDALAADKDLGQTRGIDATLKQFDLDALVLPTSGAAGPAAIAGYPIVTGTLLDPHPQWDTIFNASCSAFRFSAG